MNKFAWLGILAVVATIIGYFIYIQTTKEITVSAQTVTTSNLIRTVSANGKLSTKDAHQFFAPYTGEITALHIEFNTPVVEDDWLFTIKNLANGNEELFKSPFEGVVTSPANSTYGQNITVGSTVTIGQLIMNVEKLDFDFIANVSQTDVSKIQINDPATLVLDAFPDHTVKGTLESIGSVALTNAVGETVIEVKIHITSPLPEPKLLNLTGNVQIQTDEKNALTVSLDAVTTEDGDDIVYIVKDDKAQKRQVSVGDIFADQIEIIGGITIGELVVTDPVDNMSDGTRVNVE